MKRPLNVFLTLLLLMAIPIVAMGTADDEAAATPALAERDDDAALAIDLGECTLDEPGGSFGFSSDTTLGSIQPSKACGDEVARGGNGKGKGCKPCSKDRRFCTCTLNGMPRASCDPCCYTNDIGILTCLD